MNKAFLLILLFAILGTTPAKADQAQQQMRLTGDQAGEIILIKNLDKSCSSDKPENTEKCHYLMDAWIRLQQIKSGGKLQNLIY